VNGIDITSLTNTNKPADGPAHQKIEKSAQEFEGMLLSALWKSMGDDMKSSLDEDSTNSSFTDMGLQAVGSAMARSGGVGIGRMLLQALEKQQAAEADKGQGPK
jgi:Rod binding domain-containing protein